MKIPVKFLHIGKMIGYLHEILLNVLIGVLFLPSPISNHFIWPLNSCLLADISNHTWLPECGLYKNDYKVFLDECDMYEYNCDYGKEYVTVNYTECFKQRRQAVIVPPNCEASGHKHDRAHQHPETNTIPPPPHPHMSPVPNLPKHMLSGRRRYTPGTINTPPNESVNGQNEVSDEKEAETETTQNPVTSQSLYTFVVKQETVIRNGKPLVRVVKGVAIVPEKATTKNVQEDDNYLQ